MQGAIPGLFSAAERVLPSGGGEMSHLCWSQTAATEVPNGCVAVRLAQLLSWRLHDERVMKERRRVLASEQSSEGNLPPGRWQEILAADDEVDLLSEVIDNDAELIRPVAVAIADQHVAALLLWILQLRSEAFVDEPFDP